MVIYVNQGQPLDQLSVDELMAQAIRDMKEQVEPVAVDLKDTGFDQMVEYSIAVSMKRIADSMASLASAHSDIKSALWKIESAVSHTNDRHLNITISKD